MHMYHFDQNLGLRPHCIDEILVLVVLSHWYIGRIYKKSELCFKYRSHFIVVICYDGAALSMLNT